MRECPNCGSQKTRSRGTRMNVSGIQKHRFQCSDCGRSFSIDGASKFDAHRALTGDIQVFTAAQTNSGINHDFLDALLTYCNARKAQLNIIPVKFGQISEDHEWDFDVDLLLSESVNVCDHLRVLGNINILPTLENPIAGLDYLSKGDSLIIGHPQLMMKTLAVNAYDPPAIITTTGAITEPNYTQTKQGEKARFNHSYSAIVVEKDGDQFHLRVLNADETGGFYDLITYYSPNGSTFDVDRVEALVTGDEHAIFVSNEVCDATYLATDSIVNVLKPKYIVRHDVLDCYSISHHHRNNFFTKFAKHETQLDRIEDELWLTNDFIASTTPADTINVIVASNHNDHLYKWLNEADPKFEPWNAKIYHKLMYLMLNTVKYDHDGSFSYENPFKLWMMSENLLDNMIFTGRDTSFKLFDIELSNHGDVGTNGSRGSLMQYSKLGHKSIIGHSHSPGISKGCYQVGTSSKLKLEYTRGPSSWLNTHCILHDNGKRQMINIVNGKWRKS